MKSSLGAHLTSPNWIGELSWLLLVIRTAHKEDLGCSSSELVYVAPLTVPGDFIANNAPSFQHHAHFFQFLLLELTEHQNLFHATTSVPIFIHSSRQPLYSSVRPLRVIDSGPKTFKINIGASQKSLPLTG